MLKYGNGQNKRIIITEEDIKRIAGVNKKIKTYMN